MRPTADRLARPSAFPVVILAALGAAGCAADTPLPDRVIDAHVHAAFDGGAAAGGTYAAEEMERAFGAANVTGAVVMLPQGSAEPRLVPGRSVQCAGIGPEPDLKAVDAALASGAVACLKIYLGYVYRMPDDPAYAPVYDLAARYGYHPIETPLFEQVGVFERGIGAVTASPNALSAAASRSPPPAWSTRG